MSKPSIDVKPDERSQDLVLVINAGSSSLKFAVYRGDLEPVRLLSGVFDRRGAAESTFTLKLAGNPKLDHKTVSAQNHAGCLDYLLMLLEDLTGTTEFLVVVHRIVHGGPKFATPQIVTPQLLSELRCLSPFAPLHLPVAIGLVDELCERFPQLNQIVCFDTAFHQDLPTVARRLPIPRRFEAMGVRRYGFHGLSYEHLLQERHGPVPLGNGWN
jgi:acetate kinase